MNEIQLRPQPPVPDMADPFASYEPHAQPQDHGLKKVHRLLRNRYKWCFSLGLVFALIGVAAGYKLPKQQWSSGGFIRVAFVVPPITPSAQDNGVMVGSYDTAMNTQMMLLKSQRVIEMAMNSDEWLKIAPHRKASDPDELAKFQKALNASWLGRAEFINISFTDPDPEVARTATKCVLDAYRQVAIDTETKNRETRNKVLDDMLTSLSQKREKIALDIMGQDPGDLHPAYQAALQEQARIEASLNEVDVMLSGLPDASPTTRPAGNPATQPARRLQDLSVEEIAARDPRLDAKIRERDLADAELDSLRINGIGQQHPKWQMAMSVYEQKQKAVDEYVAQWRALAATRPEAIAADDPTGNPRLQLEHRKAKLTEILLSLNKQTKEKSGRIAQVEKYRRDEKAIDDEYEKVNDRIRQLRTEEKNLPRITVSEAETPQIAKDLRVQMAAVGGMFGIFMGFAIVLAYAASDRRVRSPQDVHGGPKRLALLGVLPSLPEDLADPEQAAIAAHCVHQIRTLLQISAVGGAQNVFAITSPAAGTGKTSLTLSLGVSFAASNCRTLIVDCDLIGGGLTARVDAIIRRKVGQIFKREGLISQQQLETAIRLSHNSQKRLGEVLVELGYLTADDVQHALSIQDRMPVGVLDALSGEALEDCIAETGIQNLSILPLGAARPGDISKLSPATIRSLLARAREHFDTILIDTGPVPGSLEASVVAAAADGVVLVVSRGEHRPMAERCIQHLHEIGARVSGLVFNRAQHRDIELSATNTRISSIGRSTRPEGQSAKFGPVALAVRQADPDSETPGKTQP